MEHQLWFTAILNKLLGGVVTALLTQLASVRGLEFVRPDDPAHPIPDYVAMEVLVILILIVTGLVLRAQLSVEKPGKLQQLMELIVEFVQTTADEIIGHGARRYVPMLGVLFLFILICNLIGLIPTLSTPTAQIQVTLGGAVAVFVYYNFQGVRQHGVLGYLKHLCGPMLAIAVLMFPIEVLSNFGRLLSLSVRLYANMLVGGVLDHVFGKMIPDVAHTLFGSGVIGTAVPALISASVPVVFMALHIFVSLLQAYIFMLLPAIYISMAVSEEH